MTTNSFSFGDCSDDDLLAAVHRLAANERHATVRLIASLAELDARRLYLAEGYSSLFTYCTQVLNWSEHAAYGRIEAARAVRLYPALLERLEAGDITLKPALVKPLAAERYRVQFAVTGDTFEKLRRVQDLMRHTCPNGIGE